MVLSEKNSASGKTQPRARPPHNPSLMLFPFRAPRFRLMHLLFQPIVGKPHRQMLPRIEELIILLNSVHVFFTAKTFNRELEFQRNWLVSDCFDCLGPALHFSGFPGSHRIWIRRE
mmetsp:Transcript_5940/g.9250  ORF Transcript_5940/g.9250 Transcript_5940/m.9250 type:complete len:116 (+) Transcript_5940:1265-1612(+)